MTYSVVARDAETGELAVAVQSHFFGTGRVVPWAWGGVGAVATQSMADATYGPLALQLLAAGRSPEDTLNGLRAADAGEATRQVAVLDARGRVAVHTGERCIADAGHVVGDGWSVQANMMRNPTVPDAMAEAMRGDGYVVDRIVAAFEAAEREGGDIRGRQSATLVVVNGERGALPGLDRTWDIRVDDHPEPVAELARLVEMKRTYEARDDGSFDIEAALARLDHYEAHARGNPELAYWMGIGLAAAGKVDEAKPILARAFAVQDGWAELLRRLPAAGLFPDDPELIERLLG